MVAALFIRRPLRRLAGAGLVAAASAAAVLIWAAGTDPVRHHVVAAPPQAEPNRPAPALLVVSSPRTISWRHPSSRTLPLYRSAADMAQDDAVIDPASGISLTLRGGEVRIFLLTERP
jgi:hypothetical protein